MVQPVTVACISNFMDSFTHWTDEVEFDIGDYTVSYPRDCPVLLYKNNKVYTLSDAYETGVIDDDMLYELYAFGGNLWGKIDVSPQRVKIELSFQK